MNKIITYPLGANLIESIAGHVLPKGHDLSRLAFIFGGHRPSLFLKREFSRRIGKAFFPPKFFSIDEFVSQIAAKHFPYTPVSEIDAAYIIYTCAWGLAPELLKGRESFADFLPWAGEIVSFIEQLDLENVDSASLSNVEKNAEIGYEVPQSINRLLQHVGTLREIYHTELKKQNKYSRGLMYLLASQSAGKTDFSDYDTLYFCNFFYLHKTEKQIMKTLLDNEKAVLIFQGDEKDWPVLQSNANYFSCKINPGEKLKPDYNLKLYAGFDTHSQVSIVREIASKLDEPEKSVLIVPDSDAVVPLIAEVAPLFKDFNVSLGYPLKRSSLHAVLEYIFTAQGSRKDGLYYAKDYLKAISHPLIKNARFGAEHDVTRVLVHKTEELLMGIEKSPLGGSLFVSLSDIEESDCLYDSVVEPLRGIGTTIPRDKLKKIINELHRLMFTQWESLSTFKELAVSVEGLIDMLLNFSFIASYPLNIKSAERLLSVAKELKDSAFAEEKYEPDDMFRIIMGRIENAKISFSGSPLKGFQMLGVMESRSLNFDNVIIMDMNESVFPNLGARNALIPRDVMLSLGLDRLEREEEIMRYQFTRLIASAKNVHLIYSEDAKSEKSRFIEELAWDIQKKTNSLATLPVQKAHFDVAVMAKKQPASKTETIIDYLKKFRYSPTSVDTYIKCPLRFYFRYVLKLEEKDGLSDEPDSADVGSFIHDVMKRVYSGFINKSPVVDKDFKSQFFNTLDKAFDETFTMKMRSDAFLLKEVVNHRMEKFLKYEAVRAQDSIAEIVAVEKWFEDDIALNGNSYRFGARIDRIDRLKDGTLLILDYKTGSGKTPSRLERLREMSDDISRDSISNAVHSFQLPIYACMAGKIYKNEEIDAALYNLRDIDLNNFFKEKDAESKQERTTLCMKALSFTMDEIINPAASFTPNDSDTDYCNHCPYFYACR